jgi:hypothetical protein
MLPRTLLATIACATLLGAAPIQAAFNTAPNAAFKPILAAVRATHVPARLPSYLPGRLYATMVQAHNGYYEIEIGYTCGCTGNACEFGAAYGQRLPSHAMEDEGVSDSGQAVTLMHGRHGTFHAFTCGASCGESTVTWLEGKYRYAIGVKAGSKAQTVKIANSAIMAAPKPAV